MSGYQFTEGAEKAIVAAKQLAIENSNTAVSPAHLASVLLDEDSSNKNTQTSLFSNVLDKAGVDVATFRRGIARVVVRLPAQDPPSDDVNFASGLLRIFRDASKLSKESGDTFISSVHLIPPLINDPQIAPLLKEAGGSEKSVKQALATVRAGKKVDSRGAEDSFEALSKYAVDLTALAEEGKLDPVIARDTEIRRCIRILSRRTKNNPILIGPPGVGKTAVAEGLAQRIVARDVPVNLIGRLYSLDLGALQAGASYKGQFEERVKSVIDEIEKAQNIILFIDEMHLIVAGQGAESSSLDAANLLKPALARGKIRCIGATTLEEYRKYIEKDQALVRRFQEVQVDEPDVPATISILRGIAEKYELHHGVTIQDQSLVVAAQLAHRYLTSRKLPDSAIDLIDEASAAVRVARDSSPEAIDTLERARTQLEIELHALERESEKSKGKDAAITERVDMVKAQVRKIDEELSPLKAAYEASKARAEEVQQVRERIDQLKTKADNAERNYDIATASDIRFHAIPDNIRRLEKLEEKKKVEDAQMGNVLGSSDQVTPDAIADIVSRWTGIPVNNLKENEKKKLLRMEKVMSKEIIGQPEALSAIANAIRLSRSGLANADRPTASFLFSGPSGTGKTQTTKCLAKFLFNSPDAILRLDASEYTERHSVSRLVGAPPGYVGYDQGGVLEYVRRKPYSIVLVDEIEKACREFVLMFLQILDDGRITDSQGRTINFKNTVIIFTSNLGSSYLNAMPEGSVITPEIRGQVEGAIRSHFPPEFLGRLDGTIIFNPLGRKQVESIVDVRLAEVQNRLLKNGRKITIEVDAAAKSWLADCGYSATFGARVLANAIRTELLDPLSKLILQDQIRDDETAYVSVDHRANRLVIRANHPPAEGYEDDEMDMDDDLQVEELD